jgi:hypothetical protein
MGSIRPIDGLYREVAGAFANGPIRIFGNGTPAPEDFAGNVHDRISASLIQKTRRLPRPQGGCRAHFALGRLA